MGAARKATLIKRWVAVGVIAAVALLTVGVAAASFGEQISNQTADLQITSYWCPVSTHQGSPTCVATIIDPYTIVFDITWPAGDWRWVKPHANTTTICPGGEADNRCIQTVEWGAYWTTGLMTREWYSAGSCPTTYGAAQTHVMSVNPYPSTTYYIVTGPVYDYDGAGGWEGFVEYALYQDVYRRIDSFGSGEARVCPKQGAGPGSAQYVFYIKSVNGRPVGQFAATATPTITPTYEPWDGFSILVPGSGGGTLVPDDPGYPTLVPGGVYVLPGGQPGEYATLDPTYWGPLGDPEYTPGPWDPGGPVVVITPYSPPTPTPDIPEPVPISYSGPVSSSEWDLSGVVHTELIEYDMGCVFTQNTRATGPVQLCIKYIEIRSISVLGVAIPLWPFVGALVVVVLGFIIRR